VTDKTNRQRDIENLIIGHFDGNLTEEQEKLLGRTLATSAEAKRIFTAHMRMEGRLHSLGRDGLLREPGVVTQDAFPADRSRQSANTEAEQNGSKSLPSSRFRVWTASSLAICVSLMLCWVLWPTSVSASGVLRKAQQVAAEMIDRTYRMSESRSNSEGRLTTHELTITVRGEGRFVVQPEHGDYVMGSDGTDYWIARRNGPVFVTSDFHAMAPELQRLIPNRQLLNDVLASPNEPLLLGMSDLLLLVKRRYDIELVDSANSAEHHVRASRRSNVRRLPSVINLHADAKTGVVLKAEVDFAESRQRTWELIEASSLSDQWYHHSQHVPDAQVQRLDTPTD